MIWAAAAVGNWLGPVVLGAVVYALLRLRGGEAKLKWVRGSIEVWLLGASWPVPAGRSAITFGPVVFFRAPMNQERYPALARHERAHVRQWAVLGLLGFGALYGGQYAYLRLRGLSHDEAYEALWLERLAERAEQG